MLITKPPVKVALIGLLSFLICLLIYLFRFLQPFENRAFDLFSRFLNPHKPPDSQIVLISVDQHSIEELSKTGIQWPWPRQLYAPILEYLSEARAVFIDILFTEPSSYGVEDDRILKEAIRSANNVYLPVFLTNQQRELTEEELHYIQEKAVTKVDFIRQGLSYRSAILPIEELRAVARGIGNVTISPDEDGVYRRIPLLFVLRENLIANLVLAYLFEQRHATYQDGSLFINQRAIPLFSDHLLVRYYTSQRPFVEVSASELLKAYSDRLAGRKPELDRGAFKDSYVFVGLTAAGLYDLKPTTVSAISTGLLIHATVFDNLLRGSMFRPIPRHVTIAMMFVLCLLVALLSMRYHSTVVNLSLFVGLQLGVVTILALAFNKGYYDNLTTPLLSVALSFFIAMTINYATVGRERRFIKRAFSQYMDEKVVDYLLKHPDYIKPGGKRRHVTVFFADIAGFTTIAERISAEDTAKMLRVLLNAFTDIIIKNNGIIDKYIGDCVMAFWGSPYSTEQDEICACTAAVQCIKSLDTINQEFQKQGIPPISMRIGINSGVAIAGNLGSDRLFDFTVIGDTVNLASRLEGVNKSFGTKIIASEYTISKTGNSFLSRRLCKVAVKGKAVAVTIYEVMALKEEASAEQLELQRSFEEALEVLYQMDLEKALKSFKEIAQRFPQDKATSLYIQRCEELSKKSLLTEQDLVFKMSDK